MAAKILFFLRMQSKLSHKYWVKWNTFYWRFDNNCSRGSLLYYICMVLEKE